MILRKVFKIGNTLAVTLPKAMAEEAGIRRGDQVVVRYSKKRLEITRWDADAFEGMAQELMEHATKKKRRR